MVQSHSRVTTDTDGAIKTEILKRAALEACRAASLACHAASGLCRDAQLAVPVRICRSAQGLMRSATALATAPPRAEARTVSPEHREVVSPGGQSETNGRRKVANLDVPKKEVVTKPREQSQRKNR